MSRKHRPHTPDGRYLVSRGILKRCTNPAIDDAFRRQQLKLLMQARMQRDRVAALTAKKALGEAGPVWWNDGTPDYSGLNPEDTPYGDWWRSLDEADH